MAIRCTSKRPLSPFRIRAVGECSSEQPLTALAPNGKQGIPVAVCYNFRAALSSAMASFFGMRGDHPHQLAQVFDGRVRPAVLSQEPVARKKGTEAFDFDQI